MTLLPRWPFKDGARGAARARMAARAARVPVPPRLVTFDVTGTLVRPSRSVGEQYLRVLRAHRRDSGG